MARGDVDVVLEELGRQPLVDAVLLGQLQGDAHQVQAEHPHPAGRVGLLEHDAVGAAFAAVDDGDVVEPEEAALEDVVALAVDLVDPPGEVDQQLVEALLQEVAVGLAGADAVHVVDAPDGPGVDRRIQVGELPFVGRDLAVGMLELLEEQHPELVLGEVRIDQREARRSGRPGPTRRTTGTPTCPAST